MVKLVVTNRKGQALEIDAQAGISTMENIRDLEGSVDAICGGMCACATCHVLISDDWISRLPPRRYEEQLMLEGSAYYDPTRSRLACQIKTSAEHDGLAFAIAPEE